MELIYRRGDKMSEISKKERVLTAQVVSEALEKLPSIGRILVAARYLDGYKDDEVCRLFDITKEVVEKELHMAVNYIWSWCLNYEKLNRCKLNGINEDILREAFVLLFRQYKYQMSEGVSVVLYHMVCQSIGT